MIVVVIVIVGAVGSVVLTYLALIGGSNYSVEDTGAHASDYGGVIEEGHGRMIALLWTTYGLMLAWIVYYLIRHWHEFSTSTSGWRGIRETGEWVAAGRIRKDSVMRQPHPACAPPFWPV